MAISSLAERLYVFKNLNLHEGRIIHAIFVIDTKCLYLSCALAQASSPLQSPYSCCQRVSSSGVLVKVSDGGAPISGGGIMSFFPCHQYILACWAVCQYKYRSRSHPLSEHSANTAAHSAVTPAEVVMHACFLAKALPEEPQAHFNSGGGMETMAWAPPHQVQANCQSMLACHG